MGHIFQIVLLFRSGCGLLFVCSAILDSAAYISTYTRVASHIHLYLEGFDREHLVLCCSYDWPESHQNNHHTPLCSRTLDGIVNIKCDYL
jgi:hypothetical protein